MITTSLTTSAKSDFLRGIHQPSDVYKMALYGAEAALTSSTTQYSPADEVSGQGYTSGGKRLSGYSVSQDGEAAVLTFDSPVWNSSTITAYGALIYNATREGKALATYDFNGAITSTNGPFTVTISSPTAKNGLIVLS